MQRVLYQGMGGSCGSPQWSRRVPIYQDGLRDPMALHGPDDLILYALVIGVLQGIQPQDVSAVIIR